MSAACRRTRMPRGGTADERCRTETTHDRGAAAPKRTLELVLIALAVGAVVLFPSLYYLFKIFKGKTG